jgi:hypothetical protein
MTVTTSIARIKHQGDGGDTYGYPFQIFDADDLRVTYVDPAGAETVLTRITEYTVHDVGVEAGGYITLLPPYDAPGVTEYIVNERINDALQNTDLRNQGNFLPKSHETQFDKTTHLIQQHEVLLGSYDRASSRVPILRTKDDVGSGGFDFLSNQGKNLDDPTDLQDAVTLGSLGAGISYDVIFPKFTWAEADALDVDTTEYEIIRVRDPGGVMYWRVRCQKKDNSYEWITIAQAPPF